MFNRIAFGGSFGKVFEANISYVNKREFFILYCANPLSGRLYTLTLAESRPLESDAL